MYLSEDDIMDIMLTALLISAKDTKMALSPITSDMIYQNEQALADREQIAYEIPSHFVEEVNDPNPSKNKGGSKRRR